MHPSVTERVLQLAMEPIVFNKNDDRDVFASVLAAMTPSSIPQLVTLLDDKSKPIRDIALDALKKCAKEDLEPHIVELRKSKKKAHRNIIAALG